MVGTVALGRPLAAARAYRARARALAPGDRPEVGWGGVGVLLALDLNDALIRRFGRRRAGWWPTDGLSWVADLERAWPEVKAEVVAHLDRHVPPTTAEVNGAAPRMASTVPGGAGEWRVVLLQSFGRPVPENARRFPRTMAAIGRTPALANVGISCLDPWSRIDEHRDPNRGALRYQLPVLVPGPPGGCRLEVSGEPVALEEGRSLLFDLAEPHGAVNDTAEVRAVLVMEVLQPLPPGLALVNRITQRVYRRLGPYRGLVERAGSLTDGAGGPPA